MSKEILFRDFAYQVRTRYSARILDKQILTNTFYNNILPVFVNGLRVTDFVVKSHYLVLFYDVIILWKEAKTHRTFFNVLEFSHSFAFELVWALGPSYIIGAMIIPSMGLLYATDTGTQEARWW